MGAKIIDWPAADLRERFPDTRGYSPREPQAALHTLARVSAPTAQ